MLIGIKGNSDINYNSEYERAFYDDYRTILTAYATQHDLWYSDLCNLLPASAFRDTPLHADSEGYRQLADRVIMELTK
jgi:hypothetical protein